MMLLQKKEYLVLGVGALIFFLFSLILHGYVATIDPYCDIDSSAYLKSGFLLYKYGTFSPLHSPQQLPLYALGYSVLIGLLYMFWGPTSIAIIWTQVALALLTGVVLFFMVRRLFGFLVAAIAYMLLCVNLGFLTFAHFLLAETLLVFLLVLFFERFLVFLKDPTKTWALFWAGVLLGVSTVVKMVAFYFFYIVLFFVVLIGFSSWKNSIKRSLVFLGAGWLVMLIFSFHNYWTFGQFRYSYNDTFNLYAVFYGQVKAQERGTTREVEAAKLLKNINTAKGSFDHIKKQFWSDVIHKPWSFIRAWLTNVVKIYSGLYATNLKVLVNDTIRGGAISYFKMPGNWWQRVVAYIEVASPYPWVKIVAWLEVIWSLVRYVLCILGIVALCRMRRYSLLAFFLTYIFYASFVIAFDGTARYRFFFEFVLIILAALGIQVIIDWGKKRRLANSL